MTAKNVQQKPSETAVFAALHRAIAHKDYPNERFGADFLAEYFLPPHFRFFIRFKNIRANVKNKLKEAFPGLHEYMIARTAFFDRIFREALTNKIPKLCCLVRDTI